MTTRSTLIVALCLVSCLVARDAAAEDAFLLQSKSSSEGGYELFGSGGGGGGELPSNGVVNIYFQPASLSSGGAANLRLDGVIGNPSPFWNKYTDAIAQTVKTDLLDDLGNSTPVDFICDAPALLACGDNAGQSSYSIGGNQSGFYYSRLTLAGGGTPGEACTNTFALSNLIPGNKYKIVLYATWHAADAGSKFTIGGGSKTCSGMPSESTAPFVNGRSYVQYDELEADSQGEIHGTWETYRANAAHFYRGPFNGIQIEGNFFNSIMIEFEATQLNLNPNTGQVTIFFNSEAGISYAIDYTDDHQQWVRRLSNLQAASTETIVVFPEPGLNSVPSRTYRVVEE